MRVYYSSRATVDAAENHSYIRRVPRASSSSAQSNKFTCKHTEDAVSTKLAHNVFSRVASSVSTVLGAPASIVLASDHAILVVVLRRLHHDSSVSGSPSSSRSHHWGNRLGRTPATSGTMRGRAASMPTTSCRQRRCRAR